MQDLTAVDACGLYLQRLRRLLERGDRFGPELNDKGIAMLGNMIADTARICIELGAGDEVRAILRAHREVAAG